MTASERIRQAREARMLHTIVIEADREGSWVHIATWERLAASEGEAVVEVIRAAHREFPMDTLRIYAKS